MAADFVCDFAGSGFALSYFKLYSVDPVHRYPFRLRGRLLLCSYISEYTSDELMRIWNHCPQPEFRSLIINSCAIARYTL